MIAAKYRLFSAEPKASKFPRYAHTEEVAVRHFDLGRHAISPGWSGIRKESSGHTLPALFLKLAFFWRIARTLELNAVAVGIDQRYYPKAVSNKWTFPRLYSA